MSPDLRLDLKLIVILVVHILVVGAMYGRITSDVSKIQEDMSFSRKTLDQVRDAVNANVIKTAQLEEGRVSDQKVADEFRGRLNRLEDLAWPKRK